MREVLSREHIRAKRQCGVKRVLAFALTLVLFAGFVPAIETGVDAADYFCDLDCSSLIDNHLGNNAPSYINHAMRNYIEKDQRLKDTLQSGKDILFFFEGGSRDALGRRC